MSILDDFHHEFHGNTDSNKPHLVFLHGLMGSAINWRRIAKAFAEDFQVLAFDQRGHGRSIQPKFGYAPEDYAEDLRRILDELQWEKVFLVGHSMGGRNAIHFTAKLPQRVMGLVVEDIGPNRSPDAVEHTRRLIELVPVPFESRQQARQFLLQEFPALLKDEPHAITLAQYFYTNIKELDDGTADWRFFYPGIIESLEEGRKKDRWEEWESIQCPVLLLRGENSRELPRKLFEEMCRRQPKAQGVEVVDSGHWIHFDQPETFVQHLKEFFAQFSSP